MPKQDNKTLKEASNSFHSIMKASVSVKKLDKDTLSEFQTMVKEKFGVDLIINTRIVYPKGITATTVIEIQKYYQKWAAELKPDINKVR